MANCKFCGKKIEWMKDGRKNIPVELDGTPHECEEAKNARNSSKVIKPSALTPEEIAKYEEAMNSRPKKKPAPNRRG